MKKIKNNFLIILQVVLLLSLLSCVDKKTTFTLSKDVIEIPMKYNFDDASYVSDIIVGEDTIKAVVDTGCSTSVFRLSGANNTSIRVTEIGDFRRIIKKLEVFRIKRIDWGGLCIKNLEVINSDTLTGNFIGIDILKNFCVKFDNYNKKILLSSNADLIDKKGIKIPFKLTSFGEIVLNLQLANKVEDFILDTGCGSECYVDSTFFSAQLADAKLKRWYGKFDKSSFIVEDSHKNEIRNYTMADCTLKEKIFKNIMVIYNPSLNIKQNYIGNQFLRRFSSFTIDYLNHNLYLELPKSISIPALKNAELVFSGKEISAFPVEYLNDLYSRYHSFGFSTSYTPPFLVNEIEIGSPNAIQLAIGDTLVGINKTIFLKSAFQKLKNKQKYRLELNEKKQQYQFLETIYRTKQANFHFLKNGKVITIKAKRGSFLSPPPFIGYGFNPPKKYRLYYGDMNFHDISKNKNMTYHFPWQTLSGREIKVNAFDDKNNSISLTNNVPK